MLIKEHFFEFEKLAIWWILYLPNSINWGAWIQKHENVSAF